jgi:hypothetical protein
MENLESAIQTILERNKRVEGEKAWETSWCRRSIIMGITYATACIFLWLTDTPRFYLTAVVPTGGYLLSTFSLPWAKRWWMKHHKLFP